MLPATASGIITLLCQPGMASAWQDERRINTTFHAGFAPPGGDGYDLIANLPRPWQPVPEWGDWPYLIGWRHDPGHAVLTYCEGDLAVEVADNRSAYDQLLLRVTHELARDADDRTRYLAKLTAPTTSAQTKA